MTGTTHPMDDHALPRFAGRAPAPSGPARPARMWPWATAGALCGTLAMLLLQMPAYWVAPAVERATGERIRLDSVRGTIWSGSAVVSLTAGPGSSDIRALPGRTSWQLRPVASVAAPGGTGGFAPGFRLQVDQTCCLARPVDVLLAASSGGIDIRFGAMDWKGPASVAQGLGMPWNTLGFDGLLRVSTQTLHLRHDGKRMQVDGRLSLTAESVSSRVSFLRPLGSYRFDIDGQAPGRSDPLRFTLATLQGPLRLSGQGFWTAGQLRFRGEAQADSGREDALANVLNLIGNRDGPVALRVIR